ncbi:hypothetical protein R1flu_015328 [Riccia fluitans]|uniref:Uncharacterized protein n=1 Tax=Riccia fluitans TaxID=41844 RepID=A0ABD1YLS2_9MARC
MKEREEFRLLGVARSGPRVVASSATAPIQVPTLANLQFPAALQPPRGATLASRRIEFYISSSSQSRPKASISYDHSSSSTYLVLSILPNLKPLPPPHPSIPQASVSLFLSLALFPTVHNYNSTIFEQKSSTPSLSPAQFAHGQLTTHSPLTQQPATEASHNYNSHTRSSTPSQMA